MQELLTIGITTHGNKIAKNIIDLLKSSPVRVIISEDLEYKSDLDSKPIFIQELKDSGVQVKYIKSLKQGIANNRQNILDNVETKFLYTIDNDDAFECDFVALNDYLSKSDCDAIYIRCYEDGRYMHIPSSFIYMCTWMQIFRTEWFKALGGYVQSWNFIHEESATNLNLRTNLHGGKYKKAILPKKLLSYKYHANEACKVTFDVDQVCNFVENIPNNNKIIYKEKFLLLFKNFTKKYISVYRINGDSVESLTNLKNGNIEDILKSIEKTKKELHKNKIKKCKGF